MGLPNLQYLDLSSNQINSLDEALFDETNQLISLYLSENDLTVLPNGLFKGMRNLEYLSLAGNRIHSLHENLFNETKKLIGINLYHNNLVQLSNNLLKGLRNLQVLDLDVNKIININENTFDDLINLRYLYLHNNHIKALNFDIFQYTSEIHLLDLSNNKLINIPDINNNLQELFYLILSSNELINIPDVRNLQKLIYLDLSDNRLVDIPDISNLQRLFYLNIKDNRMSDITDETFSTLPKQTELIAGQHEICECYVSKDINCTAMEDRSPFLTCDRLLSDKVLVVVMWFIGLNALGGNVFVLSRRQNTIDKNKIQTFLLRNLAMSDLLMGVYMLLIASADIYFGEYFPMHAETWRSSITCRIAGTISIVSSEASVFFVTLISVDRFISIKYHNSRRKLGKKSSVMVATVIWIVALVLGIVPSSLAGKNYIFYDNSHVYIGLPLSKLRVYETKRSEKWIQICFDDDICYWRKPLQSKYLGEVNGMIFASVMFLGLNFVCYLAILASYVEIIRTVFNSSKRAGLNQEMKEQIRLTAKVAAIVLTDFACWFPIIMIGILVQAGVLTLPPDVFAWCVTFVLPINSAINPYLYTIAAIINSRLKGARIAPAENQQENTNMTSNRGVQMSHCQNTQATGLEGTSHAPLSCHYAEQYRGDAALPGMSNTVEPNI